MITATKDINPQESNAYFAKCYKIKYKDHYKREDETTADNSFKPIFVRTSYEMLDNISKCKSSILLDETFRFQPLPYIPLKCQENRTTIYISAASGMGKSYLINQIVTEYKKLFPSNKVYYFTKNNSLKDRSLEPKSMYNFVNVTNFINNFTKTDNIRNSKGEIIKTNREVDEVKIEQFLIDKNCVYDNSFFIFDDVASLEKISKESSRIMQLIIDIILENKRKSKISIAIISHIATNLRQTALLIREMQQYICFGGNLQMKSDRVLNNYLGLNTSEIRRIVDEDSKISKWIVIDSARRLILTQRACYFLNSTPESIDLEEELPEKKKVVKKK